MIDYGRPERGASGVDRSAQPQMDADQLTACTLENARLKEGLTFRRPKSKGLCACSALACNRDRTPPRTYKSVGVLHFASD